MQVQNGTEQTIRMIFKLKIYKIKIWTTVLLAYVKKQNNTVYKESQFYSLTWLHVAYTTPWVILTSQKKSDEQQFSAIWITHKTLLAHPAS